MANAEEPPRHPAWKRSGDILQWALPLAGLGMVLIDPPATNADQSSGMFGETNASGLNWPGPHLGETPLRSFGVAFLRMEVTTYALKYAINEPRPNGGHQGFPSGHTAASFMGAEFIRKEYGWSFGAPAYALASWVGYTRVDAREHYWHDVIAGAIIGIASNHDFDTPVAGGKLGIAPTFMQAGATDVSDRDEPLGKRPPAVLGLSVDWRF